MSARPSAQRRDVESRARCACQDTAIWHPWHAQRALRETRNMTRTRTLIVGVAALSLVAMAPIAALCCPFCGAVKATFAQEIKAVDVAVIARLVSVPKRPESKE